jgi:hypothetical protein
VAEELYAMRVVVMAPDRIGAIAEGQPVEVALD